MASSILPTLGLVEPRRRIEHEYRVRFDEADAEGWLRPSGLLRYAQDMAWRHSTEAGFDRGWYDARQAKGSDCIECEVCIERCPFGVDIIGKMQQAVEVFGS